MKIWNELTIGFNSKRLGNYPISTLASTWFNTSLDKTCKTSGLG
jgi:hypothetical protein